MSIKRILVSQPAPATDKSPFTELASKHNIELVFRPFIEVEGVTLKEFRKQRIEILCHTAVVMTSRTAIDHFFRICEEGRIVVPETLKYFCVSEAIAHYLQKYIVYRKRRIFFGSGKFPDLMDIIVKHKDEKYLAPLSEPHKPEIPIMLAKSGVKHNIVILSHTVSTDMKDIDPTQFDILALYTPSDVASYMTNFPEAKRNFKIAVFGNGTARAAFDAGIPVDIMSPTPNYPSMITALDKYVACHNAGGDISSFALKEMPVAQEHIKIGSSTRKPRAKSTSDTKATGSK